MIEEAAEEELTRMKLLNKCSFRYFCSTNSLSLDMLYKGPFEDSLSESKGMMWS